MKNFWEVTFKGLPRSIEPAFTVWLFRQGCLGTNEILDFVHTNLRYKPKIKEKKIIDLVAYFQPDTREKIEGAVLQWIRQRSPATEVRWSLQVNQDWLKEWKKHFSSFDLAGFTFLPAWEAKGSLTHAKTVLIDPGMAFGTGTHATTQYAIRLLSTLAKGKKIKGKTVLDVGSGSGILAVVAEKLGAQQVTAIDNDPESWRECRKTFKLNQSKSCKVVTTQMPKIKQKYDVVIANIIDGVLMSLRPHLMRAVKPGGHLILSGILTDGASAFKKSFLARSQGEVVHEIADREWTSLLISK